MRSLVLVAFFPSVALGADFHVDPTNGVATNDGSAGSPWSTLERVIADGKFGTIIQPGDTVWLRSGYHGDLTFRQGNYSPPITVSAEPAARPTARKATFQQTQGWVLTGLELSPSLAPSYQKTTIVSVDANSSRVEVRDCRVYSVDDASGWTADDWINLASNAVDVRGPNTTIQGCSIRNVRFGISVTGPDALILGNVIDGFSGDGLRGLGDRDVFESNTIKNIYVSDDDGDANHDDGFQSWSTGPGGVGTGEVVGVVLRGNTFIGTTDPTRPFQATMQGIGGFDGYFTDWVVENNVVITDHWHGISFYGMRGGRIVNNTVIDLNTVRPGPPWIMVTAHKDGTPSQDVVVRNNLSTDLDISGTNVTQDHNQVISMDELGVWFVNPGQFDLHLLESSPGVNAGSGDSAPSSDRDGVPRPQGADVDLGAYEWSEAPVADAGQPVDSGGRVDAAEGPDVRQPDAGPVDARPVDAERADAGTNVDVGSIMDAGTVEDAAWVDGAVSDAASALDATTSPDPGPGTISNDGCSCREHRKTGSGWAILGVAAVAYLRKSKRGRK